jgi:hypothetical protein
MKTVGENSQVRSKRREDVMTPDEMKGKAIEIMMKRFH